MRSSAPVVDIAVRMRRGDFLLDVAFAAREGITALFGRSGAGKSSVLGAIAGLVRPDAGHIRLGEATLFDAAARIDLPRHKRRVGLVFQDAQLFPHLSVRANLLFGRRHGRAGAGPDFETVVGILGLEALLARRPASLSGGERQRVAIGRALLSAPRLLLLDEPLASLDLTRKLEIMPLIERMRDEFRIPILYVSHSLEEVARLAGEMVMLEGGRVSRVGSPDDVLAGSGPSPSEARFAGISILNVRLRGHDEAYGLTLFDHPAGEITVPGRAGLAGAPARIVIRGADVSLALERPREVSVRTVLSGIIAGMVVDAGPVARIDLDLTGGDRLAAFVTRKAVDELALAPGKAVFAMIKAAAIDGERGGS